MMRILFYLAFFFQLNLLHGQSLLAKFNSLSVPEKCWVIIHPLVARKAFNATRQSQTVTDSIKKSGVIGTDNSGGRLDAFKHAYWIACVSVVIGPSKALKLGKAHEKGNKRQFKKHRLEDHILPDSISSCMDLYNNKQGSDVVKSNKNTTATELQKSILALLEQGKLACIRKDREGNFLTCDGQLIDLNHWLGKWNIPKCMIHSDAH